MCAIFRKHTRVLKFKITLLAAYTDLHGVHRSASLSHIRREGGLF